MATAIKLMMVDDDADLLALLKVKLEKTGRFSVTATTRASEAVQLAADIMPDLVILDIDMPEITGGDVAEALSENAVTRELPVLFFSSLIPKEEAGKGLQVIGGRQMVSKYASVEQLIGAIDSIV